MHHSKIIVPPKIIAGLFIIWAIVMSLLITFLMGVKYQKIHTAKNAKHAQHIKMQNQTEAAHAIIDGSLYKVFPDRKSELVINKKTLKYDDSEQNASLEIQSYQFSPNQSKVLVQAKNGLSQNLLFVAKCAGGMNSFISEAGEAKWSPDGRYIAYTRRPDDSGPSLLYVFDSNTRQEVSLDVGKNHFTTSYSNLRWSEEEETAVITDFEEFNKFPGGKVIKKGETTIRLLSNSTLEVD
ncbi:MAG: hypothetical protein M3Q44_00560 [bacterium]|nr:hypothetical protein [bacterium]